MFRATRRHLLVILLLIAAVGLAWGQRYSLASRLAAHLPEGNPGPAPTPGAGGDAAPAEEGFVYFLDVEGWYRITPYETVVRSPFDLSAASTAEMAQALPTTLGQWQQAGPDQDVSQDPAVVEFLRQPTVALQRTYQDEAGHYLNLATIGNRGDDSFLLFSHTPETCYPGLLWQVKQNRRESALLDDRPMYAQYLLAEHADTGDRLMVLYWYLWDNPQRDSRQGVLSVRVNLFLAPDETEQVALARAWEFVRGLFPTTLPWSRF